MPVLLRRGPADRRHLEPPVRHRHRGKTLLDLESVDDTDQGSYGRLSDTDAASDHFPCYQAYSHHPGNIPFMSYELIALLMFGAMMVMLLTGQRVFAAIGFVASGAAL